MIDVPSFLPLIDERETHEMSQLYSFFESHVMFNGMRARVSYL